MPKYKLSSSLSHLLYFKLTESKLLVLSLSHHSTLHYEALLCWVTGCGAFGLTGRGTALSKRGVGQHLDLSGKHLLTSLQELQRGKGGLIIMITPQIYLKY